MKVEIPAPILSVVADHMAITRSHAQIDSLFMYADAPGEPPEGSKPVKCQEWLRRTNRESYDPLSVLGKIIEEDMENPDVERDYNTFFVPQNTTIPLFVEKLNTMFDKYGISYSTGGILRKIGTTGASKTLGELIRGRDFQAIDLEFDRALENANTDPREACSAACNVLESLFKIMIHDEKLTKPAKQDLKNLWKSVAEYLNFDPKKIEDDDLRKILSGMNSVVDGIGALRTHASAAHGAGKQIYKLEPRHARLAIHSAHTLATFVLESWDKRRDPGF
ncbi:abortive infection family protein [Marinobacter salarius]|uniref:abortive infection family protein n=1 Tax=Marinobacter salarius TaxID=1420917 RepID=UPI003BAAE38D